MEILYEGQSKSSYEKCCYYETFRGDLVGTLCHSKDFVDVIDSTFKSILDRAMIELFEQIDPLTGRPYPWTLIIDGSCFKRRDAQVNCY